MYRVGGDVDCRCTRCKMELAHTILAMVDGVPARVKCNTCHTDRKYRPLKGEKKPALRRKAAVSSTRSSGGASTAARAQRATQASQFERLEAWKAAMSKAEANGTQAVDYSMRDTFEPGAVVIHRKFGPGFVVKPVDGGKIVVCFREGEKVLVHGRRL